MKLTDITKGMRVIPLHKSTGEHQMTPGVLDHFMKHGFLYVNNITTYKNRPAIVCGEEDDVIMGVGDYFHPSDLKEYIDTSFKYEEEEPMIIKLFKQLMAPYLGDRMTYLYKLSKMCSDTLWVIQGNEEATSKELQYLNDSWLAFRAGYQAGVEYEREKTNDN